MKGDWEIIESESLKQPIAFDRNSGWLFCKDGTKYSPAELARITRCWTQGKEVPLEVHILKKTFGGEIISAEGKGGRKT